jgi:hypothetical protein
MPTSHAELRLQRYRIYSRLAETGTPPPLEWQSNQVMIVVRFDRQGRVTDSPSFPLRRADEPLLDRLRRWLGL